MIKTAALRVLLPTAFLLGMHTQVFSHDIPDLGPGVYQPQILATPDGGLLLAWTSRGEPGCHLFLRKSEGEGFAEPVRVNPSGQPLHSIPIDEMRPAFALGPENRVGLAWTNADFDIQAAVSLDGGRSFGAPLRLNQDDGEALQEFPDIAFGPDGILHAVWLDPRVAEDGLEEPADLYYGRIEDGNVVETNLTASQDSSVCGCCLPDINVRTDGTLVVAFRNTTANGFRDPFRVVAGIDGQFGDPEPVSPPVWQIELCPVAGPITVDNTTLWFDGSTGRQRLLSAVDPARRPDVVLEDSDDTLLAYPPRRVSGTPESAPVLLVPATPSGYLLARQRGRWHVVDDGLPGWATSAAIHDGELILVGIDGADFRSGARELTSEVLARIESTGTD